MSVIKQLCAAALILTAAGSCFASLGGTPSTVGRSSVALASTAAIPPTSSYKTVSTTLETGTVLHEYIGVDGLVFAVSWTGPYLPDLKDLLGTHFNTLVDASRKQRGKHQMAIRHSHVVIFSGGHMGFFEGKAYIPSRMPQDFQPTDIK